MSLNILLTGACGVTSRAAVRCLRASQKYRDSRIVGTDVCWNLYGLYEDMVEKIHKVPDTRSPDYEQVMENICAKDEIDIAIIIPELEVLFWSERALPVPVLLPPPRFSRVAISKARIADLLLPHGLVPNQEVISSKRIADGDLGDIGALDSWPLWMRDFGEGSTSGKGAYAANNMKEAQAWAILNPSIEDFIVSEYLPGRNFACALLYDKGKVVKTGTYERLEYFMGRTVMSGISGNISKGKLLNHREVLDVSMEAVRILSDHTGESMQGLVTVDLKGAKDGSPKVTEVNLRYVAAFSAFADAGFNLVEYYLDVVRGDTFHSAEIEKIYPPDNLILRDIDGLPIWIANHMPLSVGESRTKS